jgi:hypothetical protein
MPILQLQKRWPSAISVFAGASCSCACCAAAIPAMSLLPVLLTHQVLAAAHVQVMQEFLVNSR